MYLTGSCRETPLHFIIILIIKYIQDLVISMNSPSLCQLELCKGFQSIPETICILEQYKSNIFIFELYVYFTPVIILDVLLPSNGILIFRYKGAWDPAPLQLQLSNSFP